MVKADEFIESFLEHEYQSQYYDPQKAHEYYLKNRELKGKRNVGELGKSQREPWRVTKSNIDAQKKTEVKDVSVQKKMEAQQLRQTAQAKKEAIRNSMKVLIESIKARQKNQAEALSKDQEAKIQEVTKKRDEALAKIQADAQLQLKRLPPLSKGSNPRDKARRAEIVAQIKGDAKSKTGQVMADANSEAADITAAAGKGPSGADQIKNIRDSSRADLQKVSSDLKSSVEGAKSKYDTLKKQLLAKYETVYQREFDAIKENA